MLLEILHPCFTTTMALAGPAPAHLCLLGGVLAIYTAYGVPVRAICIS